MFLRATRLFNIHFLEFDGLINHEVGDQSVRRSQTERLLRTRAFWKSTSRLNEKGQR
jgi:hypothetical protein